MNLFFNVRSVNSTALYALTIAASCLNMISKCQSHVENNIKVSMQIHSVKGVLYPPSSFSLKNDFGVISGLSMIDLMIFYVKLCEYSNWPLLRSVALFLNIGGTMMALLYIHFLFTCHISKWYFLCRCVKWNEWRNCTLHAVGCVPPKMVNKWLVEMLHINKMSLRYVCFRILFFVRRGLMRSRWTICAYNFMFILKYLSTFNFAQLYTFRKKVDKIIQFFNQIFPMFTHINIF